MAGFADLIVWKEAASLVCNTEDAMPQLAGPGARSKTDQMIRAANSITSNIAEGYGKGVSRDGIRFFRIAKASCDELEGQLRMAQMKRRLPDEVVERLIDQARRVGYLILRFIASLERRLS